MRDRLIKHLRAHRYNLGYLAEEAEITRNYLSLIINGSRTPSVHVAASLARAANRLTESTTYTPDMFITITKELHQ